MTEAEEKGLRELGADLAGAEKSPWEPRCVCRAFAARPGALCLTMQGWIDLEAARSPLLNGQLPEGDEAIAQMSIAVDAFGIGPLEVDAEEMAELAAAMIDAIAEAFAMQLPMDCPESGNSRCAGGFGKWLPIFACLITQIGLSRVEALLTPVGQAFGLIAGHRRNQGWQPMEANYSQRDVLATAEDTRNG